MAKFEAPKAQAEKTAEQLNRRADRQLAIERCKAHLKDYLKDKGINTKSRFKCLNPEHPDHSPSMGFFEKDEYGNEVNKVHCFSCNTSYDIFDLIGMDYGLSDFNSRLKKACELYGINYADNTNTTTTSCSKIKPEPAKKPEDPVKEEAKIDFTDFFREAHAHISETDYHRGLSIETLNRFHVGYIKSWKYPKELYLKENSDRSFDYWDQIIPFSSRLIIPTSKYSYVARATDAKNGVKIVKVGKLNMFNVDILKTATRPVFIVEGEIDALSVIEVGGDAVGIGSTSMLNRLSSLLKVHPPKAPLILAMDNDEAGKKAQSGFNVFELEKLGVKFIKLPFDFWPEEKQESDKPKIKDMNDYLVKAKEIFIEKIKAIYDDYDFQIQEENEELDEVINQSFCGNAVSSFRDRIQNGKRYISTGFDNLDQILDGGFYSGLYVLGAISSLGKTTMLLQMADAVARNGQDVLYFSLEMSRHELMSKSTSRLTFELNNYQEGCTTRELMNRYSFLPADKKQLVERATDKYAELIAPHMYIIEGLGDTRVETIEKVLQSFIRNVKKVPVVMLDYLQIIQPTDIRATEKQTIDKAVIGLKILSRDYDTPVIAISSFNRENYKTNVNVTSFKESGAIEYTSDVLLGLQYSAMKAISRVDDETKKGQAEKAKQISQMDESLQEKSKNGEPIEVECCILKNRNGIKGSCYFNVIQKYNCYQELNINERKPKYTPTSNRFGYKRTIPEGATIYGLGGEIDPDEIVGTVS